MTDQFQNRGDNSWAPARRCFAITPHDTNELPFITKGLRAGADGTITFRAVDSEADVAHPVLKGERIDVRVTHVRATGTDVSVIGYF
jgi:hypothetical protein